MTTNLTITTDHKWKPSLAKWTGYLSDSFFSGIVIRLMSAALPAISLAALCGFAALTLLPFVSLVIEVLQP